MSVLMKIGTRTDADIKEQFRFMLSVITDKSIMSMMN